jgi:hypothetical protein
VFFSHWTKGVIFHKRILLSTSYQICQITSFSFLWTIVRTLLNVFFFPVNIQFRYRSNFWGPDLRRYDFLRSDSEFDLYFFRDRTRLNSMSGVPFLSRSDLARIETSYQAFFAFFWKVSFRVCFFFKYYSSSPTELNIIITSSYSYTKNIYFKCSYTFFSFFSFASLDTIDKIQVSFHIIIPDLLSHWHGDQRRRKTTIHLYY